jgi:predicted Zn-dependent peptidase
MDDSQECSEILAYMEMQFKSEKALVDHIARVKAVSKEDIINAANTYLQADCLSTVILKPK